MEPAIPSTRPSRLSPFIHGLVVLLLLLAFISGVVVWYGQTVNQADAEPVINVRGWLLLHGWLNPFLCGIFGYLLCQHIRLGWEMKANWLSGVVMEAVFALLILTGTGLYYSPENWRGAILLLHHLAGVLLPLSLIAHWIASQLWVKKVSKT